MSQPAEKPATTYRRRRVPMCFCPSCIAADPSRAAKKAESLKGTRLAEMRQRRPR